MKRFIYIFIAICLSFSAIISFADEKPTYLKQRNNPEYRSEERKKKMGERKERESKTKDREEIEKRVKNREDKKEKLKKRSENLRKIKEEIRSDIEKISENRQKLSELVKESKNSYKKAKEHVKSLMKQKDSLTDEQIESLKNSLVLLKTSNIKIRDSKGEYERISKRLKAARENRDFETAQECYRKLIEIQNSRIENLNKFIKSINGITEI